jgi:O-antigen/teichoic acid export membrane protein
MLLDNASNYLTNFRKKITTYSERIPNSNIIKNFFIFSFGSIMIRGISIFTAPLTLSILNPSEYGLLSIFTSFNNVLMALIGLGLRQAFYLEYFHCQEAQRKKMTNTILSIYMLIAGPISLALIIAHNLLNKAIFCNAASFSTITVSIMYCFLMFFVELFYQHLQYESKAYELTLLQTATALITICLQIVCLYTLRLGVYGMLLGYTFSSIISFAIALHQYVRNRYGNTFNLRAGINYLNHYLHIGLPFIPGVLFSWLLASGDKWVLARYMGLHDVGIYAIADAFSQLFYVTILYPMSCSYLPWLFKQFSEKKDAIGALEEQNKKFMYLSMAGLAITISFGYLIGKPILYWVLPCKYHAAIAYIWLILMGNIFWMGTYFASAIIQYHKKSHFLGFAIGLPALINIILNILLIPLLGIYGCSIATLTAYIAYFLLILGYNKKLSRLHNI